MRKLTLFLLFFILIFLFSVLSCDDDDETSRIVSSVIGAEGGSITSPDGKLTLEIPPGALTEKTEINIRKLNKDEFPPELSNSLLEELYELTPDGLQFLLPVKVNYLTDLKPKISDGMIRSTATLLFSLSDGLISIMDNLNISVNEDDSDTIVASGEITQFSFTFLINVEALVLNVRIEGDLNNVALTLDRDPISGAMVFIVFPGNENIGFGDPGIIPFPGFVLTDTVTFNIDCGDFGLKPLIVAATTDATVGELHPFFQLALGVDLEIDIVNAQNSEGEDIAQFLTTFAIIDPCDFSEPPSDPPPPTPPSQVTCANISRIEIDALIDSFAGQISQQNFINPVACDMSRIIITNDAMGITITDDVPDGSGGGIPTLTGPPISESLMQFADGIGCEFSAFGRDDIAGGNDVGVELFGQLRIETAEDLLLALIFFNVRAIYGVNTPPQDWTGDPFTVNCTFDFRIGVVVDF